MLRLTAVALTMLSVIGCSVRSPSPLPPTDTVVPARAQSAGGQPAPAATATPSPAPPGLPTAAPSATPQVNPDLLLPDLQTLPPSDVVIQRNLQTDRKLLRFSNSILNGGAGALELLGVLNPATGKTGVTQHMYNIDGSLEKRTVGEFIFHRGHNHWHLENFVLFEVWSLTAEGRPDAVAAVTDKVSYCLRDNTRADVPGAQARPSYTTCGRELQGIAVGWIDTYTFDTDGQIVDITALPDDVYALRSTVDPDNYLQESDDTNNSAVIYIEIDGDRVRVVGGENDLRRLSVPEK